MDPGTMTPIATPLFIDGNRHRVNPPKGVYPESPFHQFSCKAGGIAIYGACPEQAQTAEYVPATCFKFYKGKE